jgi:hypothetical protein
MLNYDTHAYRLFCDKVTNLPVEDGVRPVIKKRRTAAHESGPRLS